MMNRAREFGRLVVPSPFRRKLGWLHTRISEDLASRRILRSPDRAVLLKQILPQFAKEEGHVLWIGCRRYTKAYPALIESRQATCWTTDVDPEVKCFGHPTRHITADLLNIKAYLPRQHFKGIICNGVFGFGIDDVPSQREALALMAELLVPGGWLMVGWNNDRVEDAKFLAAPIVTLRPQAYGALPQRIGVNGTTHVYDFFRKDDDPGPS